MKSCPSRSSKEWKAAVAAVGEFEAMRDFMEYDDIRDTQSIIDSYNERQRQENTTPEPNQKSSESLTEFMMNNQDILSESEQKVTRGNEILNKLADRLTQNTGVKAIFLTEADAFSMLQEVGKSYEGEPGFFHNGQVYFVIGKASTEIVFHEFAHPVVKAIAIQNPQLFTSLYNELLSTPEGKTIVEQLRNDPNLKEGTMKFMEEVLTKSLGKKADNLKTSTPESNGFGKVIEDILYAIKQFMRKLFKGEKLKVENLSANTTLDQLANMLANKEFQINSEVITNDDVAYYSNAYRNQIIEDLATVEQRELNMLSKKFYKLAKEQNAFLYTKNYKEIKEVLKDKMERSDLSEIILTLRIFQTEGEKAFASDEEREKYMAAHAEALLNGMLRFNQASKRILEHFKEISKKVTSTDPNDMLDAQQGLAKAFYLNRVIKDWNKFIAEAKEQLRENTDFRSGHPLFNLINEISDNIESSKKYTEKIYSTGVAEMLIDQLTPLAKRIDEHYQRILKRYEEKGASQSVIDLYKRE